MHFSTQSRLLVGIKTVALGSNEEVVCETDVTLYVLLILCTSSAHEHSRNVPGTTHLCEVAKVCCSVIPKESLPEKSARETVTSAVVQCLSSASWASFENKEKKYRRNRSVTGSKRGAQTCNRIFVRCRLVQLQFHPPTMASYSLFALALITRKSCASTWRLHRIAVSLRVLFVRI